MNDPNEPLPEDVPNLSLPFARVSKSMKRKAVAVKVAVEKIDITYPSQESKAAFEQMLDSLLNAHLNALGMQIGIIVRSAIAKRPQVGLALVNALAGEMQVSADAAFTKLIETIEGPAVEIAGAGMLPPKEEE